MKDKKKSERMCIACRVMQDKKNLIRIVRSPEGDITLDYTGKKNGRGAYICNNISCIEKCEKQKLIHKSFKTDAGNEVYQKIKEEFILGSK